MSKEVGQGTRDSGVGGGKEREHLIPDKIKRLIPMLYIFFKDVLT